MIWRTMAMLAVLMAGGCCCDSFVCGGRTRAARPARINHMVFFKLKDPADATELISDCDTKMAAIPGSVSYFCGRHLDTGRPEVVQDYDVAFYVGFETEEAYAAYVKDSYHVQAVQKWKPRWEWIKVFDVVDETP